MEKSSFFKNSAILIVECIGTKQEDESKNKYRSLNGLKIHPNDIYMESFKTHTKRSIDAVKR